MRSSKPLLAAAALALATAPVLAAASPALAASDTTLTANLTPLNNSGATATVTAHLSGNTLRIMIKDTGLLESAPHAQHLHIGGSNTCPAADAKGKGANGALQVSDAMDSYGMIAVSLTTTGDSSAKSGLAVDRFPSGTATYSRTLTVSSDVADQIRAGKGVVVQHGVDLNKDGKYDGDVKSDLDPSLPEEATDPANCGVLNVSQVSDMPSGGVQTGGGSTSGIQDKALIGAGAALVVAGAGALGLRRRNTHAQA